MPNLFQDCPHVPLAFSPEPICFTVHFFFSGFLSHQGLALVAIRFLLCSLLPLLFTIPAKRNQNDWTSHTSIGNLLYEAFHHLQFVPNETHLSQVLISLPPYQKRVPFSLPIGFPHFLLGSNLRFLHISNSSRQYQTHLLPLENVFYSFFENFIQCVLVIIIPLFTQIHPDPLPHPYYPKIFFLKD